MVLLPYIPYEKYKKKKNKGNSRAVFCSVDGGIVVKQANAGGRQANVVEQ
jgi:hypothetical protein